MKIDDFLKNVGLPAVPNRIAYSIDIKYSKSEHRFSIATVYAGTNDSYTIISSIGMASSIFDKIIEFIPRIKSMYKFNDELYYDDHVMEDFELVNLKRVTMTNAKGREVVGNNIL